MNLINELGTDLALAFLVEQRYRQKIDSEDALALIDRVQRLLETATNEGEGESITPKETTRLSAAH